MPKKKISRDILKIFQNWIFVNENYIFLPKAKLVVRDDLKFTYIFIF